MGGGESKWKDKKDITLGDEWTERLTDRRTTQWASGGEKVKENYPPETPRNLESMMFRCAENISFEIFRWGL